MRKKNEQVAPPTANELQAAATQLSNPTSLTLLSYLYKSGFGLQSSIIKATAFSQSTVSKQLKALLTAGLVSKEKFRTCNIYSLNRPQFVRFGLAIDVWLKEN
ncbi:winged helix-turn-helix domain-containing protein [Segetibacter aerophilus]|uniref:HTH arsR-type domain-containing protein n=1 Tax=Segetibacter aerophilus TaxID=670293 RepID=A0A512BGK2_9BACT|nr:winged helix-turn-helix domain-containing protein [Segetibacter aerophilus]GEO11099.1 hypothetical protein SAE01_35950 [Segetibacter aerophilus]